MKNSRLDQIVEYMTDHEGTASVAELCQHLHVSDMTIRRDLQALESAQRIIRHHGGASLFHNPLAPVTAEPLQVRLNKNRSLKTEIGKAGAQYLQNVSHLPGCGSVFIASGSTLYCMASQLHFQLPHTTLVTDNLNISQLLAPNPDHTLIMIGGQMILPSLNAVGHMAEKMIRSFNYDYAFIGAAAIDDQGYIYTYNFIEAGTFLAIIESSKKIIVLADSTKLNKKTFVQLFQLKKGHVLITDVNAPEHFCSELTAGGVEVICC